MRDWLSLLCDGPRFANAVLIDAGGKTILFVGKRLGSPQDYDDRVAEVIRSGQPILRDFHFDPGGGPVHLGLNLPLRSGPDAPPAGALLLGIDPEDELYPLLRPWPIPSDTGESLLVRREGDRIMFLSPLRHRGNAPLRFELPAGRTDVAAVRLAAGEEGVVQALDYRGVPVLAAMRRVPGSPWLLVTKVDRAEAYAPFQELLVLLVMLAAAIILAAAAAAVLLWRRQQVEFYKQRYDAELERRALLGHYDYLSRFANDIIFLADEHSHIVEANDRAAMSYGYSRDELKKMTVRQLRHPSEMERFDAQWSAVDGEGVVFETLHQRRDGTAFPVEASVRLMDVDGRQFRQSIVRDISERKAVHEQLRQTNDMLTAVVEASPAAIIATTPDGLVRFWNAAAERMFGWTAAEVIGNPLPFVPPGKGEESTRLFETTSGGQSIPGAELERCRKDGTCLSVLLSTAPLHDRSGGVVGVIGILVDITAHKAAEHALRESERRFRATFEQAAVGLTHVAPDGRFIRVNQRFCQICGYSEEELLATSFQQITHPHDLAADVERAQSLLRGEINTYSMEKRYIRKDGSPVWVNLTASMLRSPQGDPLYYISAVEDITDRKRSEEERLRLEQQLIQAQKMESIGRLAGGVAHDFNNHLTVINGYCDLLDGELPPGDPVRESISQIRQAGERAVSLTRQLLAFSRRQVIAPKPLNLNDIVAEAGRMIGRLIGEDIELVTQLDPALGAVEADPGQIHQVLLNLAVNARDAMLSGGKLTIETSNVDLDPTYVSGHPDVKPGPYVLLAVTDTGTGMSPDTMQQIFEPFFTTKEKGAGTGLGLSTVYGIVRQSGGWIWVYSEPEKGSTFKIYLPRIEQPAESAAVPAPTAASLRGNETLLVVEDQPDVRKLTAAILKSCGYRVIEAANGGEGLLACERHSGPIHMLITDVVMPGITGRELADRLAAVRPSMKVLYVSGYTANVIVREGVLEPGVEYLQKPFTPADLALKVRGVLGPPLELVTVLVVDDDPGVRGLLRHILKGGGYGVLEAASPEETIALLGSHHVDLVIADLVMPGGPGTEMLSELRRTHPALKVVVISGAFGGDLAGEASAVDAAAFLAKPIRPDALLQTVKRVLEV